MSVFIERLHSKVHTSWNPFLTSDIIADLEDIEEKILDSSYTPHKERVLHFLTINLNEIKVLIVGQDPYPQNGVATGRAFEVGTLTDWNQAFRNVSLKNIVRLIHSTYQKENRPYKEIIALNNQQPNILPPNKLFKDWETQGVLLLNTAFTCLIGESASHSKLWKGFSLKLLQFIATNYPDVYWILWGNHAQKITSDLPLKNVAKSNHPMMCSPKSDNDFLYGKVNTFEATKHLVDWRGVESAIGTIYTQGQLSL
ncbi:MAG: uracil-DNA glycosylase [Salinivirgaceae bacterium]|nr:MAG: uracil-DNA glycosylase [Salinivirgaceae bacterium]